MEVMPNPDEMRTSKPIAQVRTSHSAAWYTGVAAVTVDKALLVAGCALKLEALHSLAVRGCLRSRVDDESIIDSGVAVQLDNMVGWTSRLGSTLQRIRASW